MTERAQVIFLNTPGLNIQQVKEQIQRKLNHTYLNKHIPKPVIDEEKIILLYAILKNRTMPAFHKERYIVTTMLVQIALDTHDTVPVFNDAKSKKDKISMQLKVLAGDYYSGLYYLLLSDIEDISLTHHLAAAIKEINEYKMKLYYREMSSFEDYIYIRNKIDSLLIQRVAEFSGEETMARIAGKWNLIQLLLEAKKGSSKLKDTGIHDYINNPNFSIIIDMKLKESMMRIRKLLENHTDYPVFLKKHIEKKLTEELNYNTFCVEEG